MTKRSIFGAALTAAWCGVIAGCSGWPLGLQPKATALQPSSFYAAGSNAPEAGAPVLPGAGRSPAQDPALWAGADPAVPTFPTTAPATQSAGVQIPLPDIPATQTSARVGSSSGKYLIYDAVLATVYDQPIYADKIVRELERLLSSKARELPPNQFAAFARRLITEKRDNLIRDEILFIIANRDLSDDDKQQANALTMKWRTEQIQASGGSVELAREHAAADLQDFDDLVQQRYRFNMLQMYLERRIFPRIQVAANDIREFYTRNAGSFKEPDQASFRLIKIAIRPDGLNLKEAQMRAQEVRGRALEGEEFAQLAASNINDDPELRKSGGLVLGGSVQRDAFIHQEVEKAVWLTGEGHITDVIRDGDAFYVAKVVELRRGQVALFEDKGVQRAISDHLFKTQVRIAEDAIMVRAMRDHIVDVPEGAMQITVDMVMQKYSQWHGG